MMWIIYEIIEKKEKNKIKWKNNNNKKNQLFHI